MALNGLQKTGHTVVVRQVYLFHDHPPFLLIETGFGRSFFYPYWGGKNIEREATDHPYAKA
jgi:hypothetical protein